MTQSLFEPYALGDLHLPHRILMAPMTRNRAAEGKLPTSLMAHYYAQRAGAGLIISESIEIDPFSSLAGPTRPGLFTNAQQAGWASVVEAVHVAGGRIFAQLSHMGRATHPSQLLPGAEPIGPSPLAAEGMIYTADGPQPFPIPREAGIEDIVRLVAEFGASAARARVAGFDGIEIQASNGYLIDQFLRDGSNRRTDAYGGSPDNRARFLLEIIEAVRQYWPANRIGVRFSPNNPFQGMEDSDRLTHFARFAALLAPLDLAYLHVIEPAVASADAIPVAGALRQVFKGPLILAGKHDALTANAAITGKAADLIAFGEAFLANPDLPARFRLGAALNPANRATFYTAGERGYTDYPTLTQD